jgi:uncharacterized OsmC-like protein
MTSTTTPVNNGVDIEFLHGARGILAEQPAAAQFEWRVTNTWVNGTHNHSIVEGFFGMGEEMKHHTEFHYDADHPEQFHSEDKGGTPVELVLVALASCLTGGIASVAQNRDIQLRAVSATLKGKMDMRGTMGVDADVRNGFGDISVSYSIDADATADEIAALVAQSQKRSAVFDIITNPTNVTVEVG